MRVAELLSEKSVMLHVSIDNRQDALGLLVELQENGGGITNGTACFNAMCARENSGGSTAIGEGIALPHAANYGVSVPGISCIALQKGIDWEAPDKQPINLIFMIAVPAGEESMRLHILARLVNLLSDTKLVSSLRKASNEKEFIQILALSEKSKFV